MLRAAQMFDSDERVSLGVATGFSLPVAKVDMHAGCRPGIIRHVIPEPTDQQIAPGQALQDVVEIIAGQRVIMG